jgi:hypothetical protein
MVSGPPSRPTTAPTLAEPIPQLPTWGSRPVKGGPCTTSALAHLRYQRYPSWQGQPSSGGYSQDTHRNT